MTFSNNLSLECNVFTGELWPFFESLNHLQDLSATWLVPGAIKYHKIGRSPTLTRQWIKSSEMTNKFSRLVICPLNSPPRYFVSWEIMTLLSSPKDVRKKTKRLIHLSKECNHAVCSSGVEITAWRARVWTPYTEESRTLTEQEQLTPACPRVWWGGGGGMDGSKDPCVLSGLLGHWNCDVTRSQRMPSLIYSIVH
jgi:hypothetical protein